MPYALGLFRALMWALAFRDRIVNLRWRPLGMMKRCGKGGHRVRRIIKLALLDEHGEVGAHEFAALRHRSEQRPERRKASTWRKIQGSAAARPIS